MQIKFLGNWSSHIRAGKRNVSILIDRKIILDFGPHTIESLLENNIDPCSIKKVLISHMHLDHYGGLAELLWYRAINHAEEELSIMGPSGIKAATENILKLYFTPDNEKFKVRSKMHENNTGREVYEVKPEYIERTEHDYIESFPGNHIIPDSIYRLDYNGFIITYTGDTAYTESAIVAGENADILLHEMTYTDEDSDIAAFWKHSTYSSAMKVFKDSRAKKLVPVHLTNDTFNLLNSKKHENVIMPVADIEL